MGGLRPFITDFRQEFDMKQTINDVIKKLTCDYVEVRIEEKQITTVTFSGKEIEKIEQSAERIKMLGQDNPSLRSNSEILLNFVYILKFITPDLKSFS